MATEESDLGPEEAKLAFRLVIAGVTGVGVALITVVVAWRGTGSIGPVSPKQWTTRMDLRAFDRAILTYREENNCLPLTLSDLQTPDRPIYNINLEGDAPLDGWHRPLEYTTDGAKYTLSSLGRDGKTGGRGLDYDLTPSTPFTASPPTFAQFLFDCPTGPILTSCLLTGLIAFALSWNLARPHELTRQNLSVFGFRLVTTAIGTVIVGFCLAVLHIPSGH